MFARTTMLVVTVLARAALAQCSDVPFFALGDGENARFGTSVAISADGTAALAGGPSYQQDDMGSTSFGAVRVFTNDGSGWTEGDPLQGDEVGNALGELFGQAVAMNDAGTLALVGAPRNFEDSDFAGRVYVFERTPGGDWTKTDEWGLPPGAASNASLGQSLALTPDGSTALVGSFRGAWSRSNGGGGWGPWRPLTPATSIGPTNVSIGDRVAISADAQFAAVKTASDTFFGPGRVLVFENAGDAWTEIARLAQRGPDTTLASQFGSGLAFAGHTLLATDARYEAFNVTGIYGSPLFIYEPIGGAYPADPLVLYPPAALMPTAAFDRPAAYLGAIAVRGETALVGAPDNSVDPYTGGRAYTLKRVSGEWTFTDRFGAPFVVGVSETRGFGAAVALAADEETFIIGADRSNVAGSFDVGEVHFPDRVFGNADMELDPFVSGVTVTFDFPGIPTQTLTIRVNGVFDLRYGVACEGDTDLVALDTATLSATEPSYTITGPLGVPVTYSEVTATLVTPTEPVGVGSGGELILAGTFRLDAMQKIGILPATPISTEGYVFNIPAVITSGEAGTPPLTFSIAAGTYTGVIDIGFGDANPTLVADYALTANAAPPCPADLAEPFGQLTFADITAFLSAFVAQDPAADLAAPAGQLTFADISAFLAAFNAGCP